MPIPVLGAIAAGSGIISGIANIFGGGKKRREAKRLVRRGEQQMAEAWAKRKDFEVPESVQRGVDIAQQELNAKPGVQQYLEEAAQQRLGSNLSAVRRYATSSADALAAASGAAQVQQQDLTQAALAGAQERGRSLDRVLAAGSDLADYQTLQYDVNVNMPFLQKLAFSQDLIAAGRGDKNAADQQIFGGIHQAISGASSLGAYLSGPRYA